MTLEALAKQGQTTVYDSLVASIGPRIRDLRKESLRESFNGFLQAEHRMESVAVIHGIEFVNDSRSSNINGAWYALESSHRPVIWIAGGVDPGNDYAVLRHLVRTKVKGIVCLGPGNHRIHEAFSGPELPVSDAMTMNEAVETAYYMGAKGDVVLLSPACASFDLFENYEARGLAFRKAVKNL